MADKEATVYIVDVGRSMGEKNNGRNESDLDYAMHYVWDKITSTVATGRKTAMVGVIGLRTDDTKNVLDDDEMMSNITTFQPISQILMPDLRNLRELIKPSETDDGDTISSLILAIHMISEQTRKLKYIRRIFLITNGKGTMDDDGLQQITDKIKEDNMELTVLGVDFDDPDYGFKEEDKDPAKASGEELLRRLTDACDGQFGTVEEAVSTLGIPRLKSTRPIPSYKGMLSLGDSEKYETAMEIDVERYPRVMVAKPPSAHNTVVKAEGGEPEGAGPSKSGFNGEDVDMAATEANLAAVKNVRTYQVEDPDAPGGKRDVELDELAKGYEYGRTAVHISESEWNVTKLEDNAARSLSILGFVKEEKYRRYFHLSRTSAIIASKTNDKASMALSALIHALKEAESYAVARFISKEGKDPVILLLAPEIEPDHECLIDVELPFAEDIRSHRFPPLDKVVTVSGKNLFEHRSLPNDDLMSAMEQYVDNLDLSTFGKDDEGNPMEYMQPEETFSPVLHRINQALRWRAVHPEADIPPPYEILTQFSNPPQELAEQAQPSLNAVIKAADIKKVPPKAKGRKRQREVDKPLSGLDIGALLGSEKRVKISSENAIPEFKQLLETSEDPSIIKSASAQLVIIIEGYVKHSVGDSGYGRAVEAIRVFREEMIELEEPGIFNDFVKGFKTKVLEGQLGGERKEMWWLIRVNRLGLIHKGVSPVSAVEEDEAKAFLSPK